MSRADEDKYTKIEELLGKLLALAADTGRKVDKLHDVEMRHEAVLAAREAARVKKEREEDEMWRQRQAARQAAEADEKAKAAIKKEKEKEEAERQKQKDAKEEALAYGAYTVL